MEDIKLNEITQKVLSEKLENGFIEKKISESLDKCLGDVIESMFSRYDSPLKKQLVEKLEPIISLSIADSTFEGLTTKLTIIINDLIEKSEFSKINDLEKLNKVLGSDRKAFDKNPVKLSEIFEKYNKWLEKELEKQHYNQDELDFDDGSATVYFDTSLEIVNEDDDKENDRLYFSRRRNEEKYRLKCEIENTDVLSYESDFHYDIEFSLYESYDGKKRINISRDLTIDELSNLPPFILYLYNLHNNYIDIIVDKTYFTDEIVIDVEYEY